ncbi:hypothetical protein MJO28_000112 [Puccinia striiformis f. sp. tritici]|uniref:Uncharacterized protein n=1 Tax=Puccinia striiformis f. sp. tritici TaxID=168172 RepID=A0ACC0F009_9BASI|nr:hypothetical protein Pst134EA_001093 [Puccinia striiformis f. sp. tritici]KAH9467317.1 hypothetical protein Pst134EB_002335 [Puccinia striiformis f. sp. tritici]KAH9474042.1 hypothetical protein Pst134EA_001093 [Puccinia striiformis f. sp. tritici]KAI7962018.1 hypothetical protein MJO28_000112 [Puccinia striiformis f. sp. tritici]KAI7967834.1 hypothetical protein MJO29_001111 [Puccinia striiformis f. sp. tritici]
MLDPPGSVPMKALAQSTSASSATPIQQSQSQSQSQHTRTASGRASIGHIPSTQLPRSSQPIKPRITTGTPDRLHFHNLANGVVKSRQGSVLSRGSLLKTDYFASGRAQSLTHHLQGAPNFRSASYNIFGTAQPTLAGIKTVLAFLKSHPTGKKNSVWFCTREEPVIYMSARPFVLRDSVKPTQSVTSSENAENIDAIELRLKLDIIKESQKYGGLILVHDETVEGDILPTWITADDVKTTREMWEGVKSEGYHVDYYRIPIANDQAPEDSYLDRYVAILRTIPTSTNLIFNCGMGLVRTTFAMAAAIIMRRRQVIKEGGEDLYGLEGAQVPVTIDQDNSLSPINEAENFSPGFKAIKALTILGEQQLRTKSLLRLMQLLQRSLPTASQHSVMELLTTQPNLLENLRKGISGEFDIVLSLVSILDRGNLEKDLVDMVVDHCDDVVNLRDQILEDRIKFAITATTDQSSAAHDETSGNHYLRKALSGLERYFFLIAFAGYCNEPPMSFKDTFSPWLKSRSEILNMILRLRRTSRQYIFAPLHDLTSLSKSHVGTMATTEAMKLNFNDLERAGGEVVGMEWAHHVVDTRRGITLRAGLILKSDQWPTQFHQDDRVIPGALNFRKVPDVALFGLSQPTQEGIERVIEDVKRKFKDAQRLTWINLREEPLIYINGVPYVLRLEAVGLRNLKSYAGISSPRLELLEDRLKSDILAELRAFDGRILLHTETDDGSVIGVWETATESAVKTLRELMDEKSQSLEAGYKLDFRRQPITAEKAPDFEDIKDLIGIVSDAEPDSPFIVNCQLGRGRSTLTMVCILLIQQWLAHGGGKFAFAEVDNRKPSRWSYQTINNLIRVMRNGRGIKTVVDAAIEKCSAVYDLIESIEVCRLDAERCGDDSNCKEKNTKKGLSNLRRYAFLLIFACYLNETKADTWRELQNNKSFEAFWQQHQVFKTILDELNGAEIHALTPLELGTFATHGGDWTEEEQTVVARRSGIILSAQTILKSDFFVGLQKMTLPMRVEGLPNIRQVPISLKGHQAPGDQSIFGSGMPTVDGLRRGLEKMGAMQRMVYWTSMREEPVLYVQGRPHVLRLFDQPLENVVTTGVAAAAVEGMEEALKNDVLKEISDRDGRILLHDEVEENGKFIVTAVWETVEQKQIMTPREVFNLMKDEGFLVDYARLPVTDEQAPIPGVFSRLEQRVTRALESNPEDELGAHLVFNCQMGRGRTTTGMVAGMLVANSIRMNKAAKLERKRSTSSVATSVDLYTPAPGSPHSPTHSIGGDTWDVPEVNPYLEGEYKTILSLISVLQHGRLAKKLTDRAIDAMDSVQNLRKAIYDFKLRAEAAEPNSEKQRKILTAATNYLYRYGSLIAFSNWLLERQSQDSSSSVPATETDTTPSKKNYVHHSSQQRIKTFPEWLNDHREVLHILQKRSLE